MVKGVTRADLKVRKDKARDLFSAGKILAGLRLLLVEDGADNQILMSRFLTGSGATVSLAVNGAEGLEMSLKYDYDLVLMDMQMPILDGYEATMQLRKEGCLTPLVALEACLAAGCVEYLSKPIKANLLVETVAKFARRKS